MAFGVLGIVAALLLALTAAQDPDTECGECDRTTCSEVTACPGGVVQDSCECCQVCARSLGQRCDLTPSTSNYGTCGEFMQCRPRTDIGNTEESTCVCEEEGPVCGSNGITFQTLCHLLQTAAALTNTSELFVSVRGPCRTAPVIKSQPEDKTRPLGSILVLDCEAAGYPVPEITWELNRLDGSSFKLPSDDSTFAVQIRGGPEAYMVTGWVQIMRITKDTLGIYTCVATNSEGTTKASAIVTLEKKGEREGATNSL